jgi:DNA-binding transcriptional MocR family regulator
VNILDVLGRWSAGSGPLYQRLASAIRHAIERGDLAPGTRLPAERSLATSIAVSRSTVVTAYDILRQEGILESRQGSGTWVPARESAHVQTRAIVSATPSVFRSMLDGASSAISLTAACSPGCDIVTEAAAELIAEGALIDETSRYGFLPFGLPAMRAAVARHFNERNLPTTENNVIITTGAQQAMSLLANLMIRPGDAVVVENPTYPGSMDAFTIAGARLIPAPVDDAGVRTDALSEIVARARPRLVYLIPTNQNPTGTVLGEHRRRDIARLAEETGTLIVEDEAVAFFPVRDDPVPTPIAARTSTGGIVTIGSMSKLFWGGLRIGWARAPEPLVAQLARAKIPADIGSSIVSQAIAARLLPRAPEVIEQRRIEARESIALLRGLLADLLPDWRLEGLGVAAWVKIPYGDAAELAATALRHGVEIVPGSTLSPDGSFRDHVRIPFSIEPDRLRDGIERLARAWNAYAPSRTERRTRVEALV